MNSGEGMCNVCEINGSIYRCPRCFIAYCSTRCYKKHSELCTQKFAEYNIKENMKGQFVDEEEKNNMKTILKRMENEDTEEDFLIEDEEELVIIQQMLESDSFDFEKLTHRQQHLFEKVIRSDQITSLVQTWTPWWNKLVFEIDDPIPSVMNPIPQLSTLTSVTPSPCIAFNLLHLLFSYSAISRFFNGERDEMEWSAHLLALSPVLASNKVFQSISQSIETSVGRVRDPPFVFPKEAIQIFFHDVEIFLSRKNFCLMALSDMHNIFQKSYLFIKNSNSNLKEKNSNLKEKNSNLKEKNSNLKEKQNILNSERKMIFYLAWINDQSGLDSLLEDFKLYLKQIQE